MKMPAPPTDVDFQPCPAGSHVAVCYRLIDLGTQQTSYLGQIKHQRKIYLEFQVPSERTSEGHPFTVGSRYTLSSSTKSTLRQHLEAWRGRKFEDADIGGFDLSNLLGKSAIVTVVHSTKDGKTFSDLSAITNLPKGSNPAKLEGEPVFFSLEPDEFCEEVFESLSEKLRDIISNSPEYRALKFEPN